MMSWDSGHVFIQPFMENRVLTQFMRLPIKLWCALFTRPGQLALIALAQLGKVAWVTRSAATNDDEKLKLKHYESEIYAHEQI